MTTQITTPINVSEAGDSTTGTTAFKVVKLDSSGKLPAVDGSALTGLPVQTGSASFQILPRTPGTLSKSTLVGATADGSAIFIAETAVATSYNNVTVTRFQKDASTLAYKRTHSVNLAGGGANLWGTVCLTSFGGYTYIFGSTYTGGTRVNSADLTGETTLTLSGTTLSNYPKAAWNDGTFLYVLDHPSGYSIKKFSVSDTTITYVSEVAVTTPITGTGWLDATYFYVAQPTSPNIMRINRTSGATTTYTDGFVGVNFLANMYYTNFRVGSLMCNIACNNSSTSDLYSFPFLTWWNSTNY